MHSGENLKIIIFSVLVLVVPFGRASEHSESQKSSRDPATPEHHGTWLTSDSISSSRPPPSMKSHQRRLVRNVDKSSGQQYVDNNAGLDSYLTRDLDAADLDSTVKAGGPKQVEAYRLLRPFLSLPGGIENKFTAGSPWIFPGLGYFARGGRANSNFIRFGRNTDNNNGEHNGQSPVTPAFNNYPNKKNNFIRLGRENPRQNNFIRLGRSGYWDSRERPGVGFFPDYVYTPYASINSPMWSPKEDNSESARLYETSQMSPQV